MKIRKNHDFGRARARLESRIAKIRSEIQQHIEMYSSKYGGFYDSFEAKAPAVYITTTDRTAGGVRAVKAGPKTRYGRKKVVVYLTTPRLQRLVRLLAFVRKKAPTEAEVAESEKRKKQRKTSAERRQRRIRRLIDLGFSAEFAAGNHSTDAAYALLYLEGKGLVRVGAEAREVYAAIEANRQTGGKLYPAWLRDEVGDSDFIHRVLAAYRRHAYTDYDDILIFWRKTALGLCGEDAREMAREQIRQ